MSLKDIWNNIINFDLTLLGSEAVVVPVTIFATFIAYYFIYQLTDERFFVKRLFAKLDDVYDLFETKWYFAPVRLLLNIFMLFLMVILLFIPVILITSLIGY